jgi:hypothetical protein
VLTVAAFAAGAVVSVPMSWLLVSRLERIGERLSLSEALLGLVAALAADAPEVPPRLRRWPAISSGSARAWCSARVSSTSRPC